MIGLFRQLRLWGEFVKFSHTVFALPFAIASMAVAARDQRGWPGGRTFGLILVAMVCARTCAMAFNRIADRHFDAVNPRTAQRPLPTGRITLAGAWTLWALSALGLVAASYGLNRACFLLSPVAVVLVCLYSLTKRFTDFTHVFLGIALALAPLGAWIAVTGGFDLFPVRNGVFSMRHSAVLALLLAVAVVFWLIGFDIIYALQDYEFDRRHGLRSLVVRWGVANALKASFLAHLIMWVTIGVFGFLARFWIAYLAGLAVIGFCLVLEHWLARKRSLDWIHLAFFRLNAVISLVFLVVTTAEVAFPRFRLIFP
ncbi:MAG TPA: UbiA-like polyprenyltransferase [Verrucomicrobiota bacterium]|nr:UbiA-like polyprenyltransferase [Verrucomicrobiota bacterium]HNU49370.1 UbiA-like polyprenyltransferase [Verrucomicrobiota bacterium]